MQTTTTVEHLLGPDSVCAELIGIGVVALRDRLDSGRTTSVELVRDYLSRIDAYDAGVHSSITLDPRAIAVAQEPDDELRDGRRRGALHGIPVLVKDNYTTEDLPASAGLSALAAWQSVGDAWIVTRLRAAGAVLLGKSNLDDLGMWVVGNSSRLGGTKNPLALDRSPDGSSGGSAAAVAAGFAPVAFGTDTCGSIRIPAAHSGLVGLRPTAGLLDRSGVVPMSPSMDTLGAVTHDATDTAFVLDAILGEGAPTAVLHEPDALLGRRVLLITNPTVIGLGSVVSPVTAVVHAFVDRLKARGVVVDEIELPEALLDDIADAYITTFEMRDALNDFFAQHTTPAEPVPTLESLLDTDSVVEPIDGWLRGYLTDPEAKATAHRRAIAARYTVSTAVDELFATSGADAVLYPTTRQTAPLLGEAPPRANSDLAAATGLPALSLPAGRAVDGLPFGVEMLGRAWSDRTLLAMAQAML
ncbi:amidase [Plantibacter flavus]|uniref:amidase n=1 Tax=Plantibacter flavus TaxID=150123 RepID=UPI003F186A0B